MFYHTAKGISLKTEGEVGYSRREYISCSIPSPIVVLLSDMTIKVILNIIQIVFAMKVHNVFCVQFSIIVVFHILLAEEIEVHSPPYPR